METKAKKVGGRWRHLLAVAALPLLLSFAQPVQALVNAEYPFELDANPWDAPDAAHGDPTNKLGDDWSTPPDDPVNGGALKFTGILQDTAPKTVFTGGEKDILDIDKWGWKDGSVPDKDNLTHAYAAAYSEEGDLLLYYGADRFSNVGDAFMGFWFFKDKITVNADGSFDGVHTPGDTLVLIDFPQGANASPVLSVVVWDPTCKKAANNDPQPGNPGDCAAANLRLRIKGSGANDTVCVGQGQGQGGSSLACALTNTGDVTVPGTAVEPTSGNGLWSGYTPKSGTPGVFPFESFFEGGINITQILGSTSGCFSSFMAETRSSSSFTASLKDFVLGDFELCGVSITKTCTLQTVNANTITYAFEGTVTNDGFGPLHDVVVTDNSGTPGDTSDDVVINLSDIPAGGSLPYSGTFDSTGNGPTNGVAVKAASNEGGEQSITDATTAPCPAVSGADINVTKSCETKVDWEIVDGKLVLRVDYSGQVCNPTNIKLNDVTVTDDPSGNVHNIGEILGNDCKDYSGSYYPDSSGGLSDPSSISFSDTVTATGTPQFGLPSVEAEATANCPLCE